MPNPTIALTGRLTAAPEVRFTPNGVAAASLTIATNDRRKDGDQWTDVDPSFWRCTAWRQLAESLGDLTKGQAVIATGRVKQRDWTDKQGGKRTAYEVDLDAIGPDLRWSQPSTRPAQQWGQQQPADDPWNTNTANTGASASQAEAPF